MILVVYQHFMILGLRSTPNGISSMLAFYSFTI